MAKLVFSLILAILLLIFASQNMHEVQLRLVFGSAVELPMILVVASAFVAGYALATFNYILRVTTKKKGHLDVYE